MEPADLIRGGFGNICLPLFGSAWLAVITGRSVERSVILISNKPPPLLLLVLFSPPLFFFKKKNHRRLVRGALNKIPFDNN